MLVQEMAAGCVCCRMKGAVVGDDTHDNGGAQSPKGHVLQAEEFGLIPCELFSITSSVE